VTKGSTTLIRGTKIPSQATAEKHPEIQGI